MATYLLVGIAAKYVHSNLGARALEAGLGPDSPYDLRRMDFTINQQLDDMYGAILQENPQVVFFSVYIWNREICDRLSQRLTRALPDLEIYYGGPEASYQAREILACQPEVDGIFQGEGEEAFRAFLQAHDAGQVDLSRIPSLVYRDQGGIRANPRPAFVEMADLPLGYAADFSDAQHQIVYYESSRGCPYACAYCLSSLDRQLRERPLDQTLAHIDAFIAAGLPQVKFIDRTFNAKPERALAIWDHIMAQDRGQTNFHFEVTAEILTDQALELLSQARPGLFQFEIGVQSTHLPTLHAVHRHMDYDRLQEVVAVLRQRANIHLHLDLIAGLPYEDLARFRQSFNDVFSLRPHDLQLGFLKVLPGTEIHQRAQEYGIAYDPQPPYEVLRTAWLSPQDLQRLKDVEDVLSRYYNSGRFLNSLDGILHQFPDPFQAFEALAQVYRQAGFKGQKVGLSQEADALRQLVMQTDPALEAAFLPALTTDLYLRNRPRRLPAWVPDYSLKEKDLVHLLAQPIVQDRLQAAGITEAPSRLARKHLGAKIPQGAQGSSQTWFFYYDRRDIAGNALMLPLDP